jgi:hypothetical protein
MLCNEDKGIEIVYGEEKYICTGPRERQNKNLLYRHDKPNEQTKEGSLSSFIYTFTVVSS